MAGRFIQGATEILWGGFQTWRWMFRAKITPAYVFLSLLAITESPRYLVAAGKIDEACKVLKRILPKINIRGKVVDVESTMQKGMKHQLRNIFDSYTGKRYPLVWVGIGSITTVYGYKYHFLLRRYALLQNVISDSVNIFVTFVVIILIDKVDRKPLLLVELLGQAVMLGVMTHVFSIAPAGGPDSITLSPIGSTIALVAANSYIAFFAFSWGAGYGVMLPEKFPNHYRGCCTCGMWDGTVGANFIITISFPALLTNPGLGI